MKVVIVGGSAAGASCATRLRRLDEKAEIMLLEKTAEHSVSTCGLPYYIGGVVEDRADMISATPLMFDKFFNIDVRINTEIVSIDRKNKSVLTDTNEQIKYDKLVLATGSRVVLPKINGMENLPYFTIKTLSDADSIKNFIKFNHVKSALIIGAGFSGIEMAENLAGIGIKTTVADISQHILPTIDEDMVGPLEQELRSNGINLILECNIKEITSSGAVTDKNDLIPAEMLILASGTKPNTEIAVACGLKTAKGFVCVDEFMRTSDADIYACGDIAEVTDFVSAKKTGGGLAGSANRQGRLIASHIAGRGYETKPIQWSGVLKVFTQTVAFTGANEYILKKFGVNYQKMIVWTMSNAGYFPNAEWLSLKVIYNPINGKILGAQAVGKNGAEKRIDVISAVMKLGGTVKDLRDMELCYSPPYSNAKDAVNIIGMAIDNVQSGLARPYFGTDFKGLTVLDVRSSSDYKNENIAGSINIPSGQIRERITEIPLGKPILVICYRGYLSYVVSRILKQHGIENVSFYAGGWQQYKSQI